MPIPYSFNPLGISVRENMPLTFTAVEASTIKLTATGSPTVSGLHYRLGTSCPWLPYTIGTVIPLAAGEAVQFWNRADTLSLSANVYVQFTMTGIVKADGNIQSMLNYSRVCPDYGLRRLFMYCPSLITPPECPAKTVKNWGCSETFRGTSITESPFLPATVVENSGYRGAFRDCRQMTVLHEIAAPALANSCCYDMCVSCTKLTSAKLTATSLATSCLDSAFYGCSALSSVEVAFTEWLPGATRIWLSGVSGAGTFVKPTALEVIRGVNNIPTSWQVIDK